jgi:hypothetical protein
VITTVTTATITTLSTTAAASLTLIVVLTLLAFLLQKELIGGVKGPSAERLRRAINIAIVPLAVVFLATVVLSITQALS